MLNMQNVKDIEITEGDVRTIHDKDSRLIWGRLAYDTKYAGDTLQNGTPTPDVPVAIQVVTGEQTVTISDGVSSQSYTIDLGSIELCKIDTYQDYIYKSGDDWYVHKEIGKILLKDVASNFEYGRRIDSYSINKNDYLSQFNLPNSTTNYYVTTFTPKDRAPSEIGLSGVGTYVNFNYNNTSTSAGLVTFRNWLTTSLTTMYAPLATPTDTKITDATLLGQLNSVHEWLTRYGYNATVTGNLPLIINQTNL